MAGIIPKSGLPDLGLGEKTGHGNLPWPFCIDFL